MARNQRFVTLAIILFCALQCMHSTFVYHELKINTVAVCSAGPPEVVPKKMEPQWVGDDPVDPTAERQMGDAMNVGG
jgi:hypothetical protein